MHTARILPWIVCILLPLQCSFAEEQLPPVPEDAEPQSSFVESQSWVIESQESMISGTQASFQGDKHALEDDTGSIASDSDLMADSKNLLQENVGSIAPDTDLVADSKNLMADQSDAISDEERALQENDQAILSSSSSVGEDAFRITENEEEIQLELKGDVLFAFNRSGIRKSSLSVLEQVRDFLKQYPEKEIVLEGHTDSIGSQSYNQILSLKRAHSVRGWLIHRGAISAQGLTAHGLGENRPIAPNRRRDGSDNPQGRQKNRRVEIRIKK